VIEFVGPAASGKSTVSRELSSLLGSRTPVRPAKMVFYRFVRYFIQPWFFGKAFLFCREAGFRLGKEMALKTLDLGLAQGFVWLQKKRGGIVLSQGVSRDVWKCCRAYDAVSDWAEPVSKLLLPDMTVIVNVDKEVRAARSASRNKVKKSKRIKRIFGGVGSKAVDTSRSLELVEAALANNGVKVICIDTSFSPEENAKAILREIVT
jgi:cytidylate kinase